MIAYTLLTLVMEGSGHLPLLPAALQLLFTPRFPLFGVALSLAFTSGLITAFFVFLPTTDRPLLGSVPNATPAPSSADRL